MRTKITFRCSECKEENYIGSRNKSNHPDRMIIKKFCPRCNKMTEHNEKK
ncbi:MAG TPA: 50S ribosomal protein L33 [Erysipelotrichaceae bacterium]|nr:50S ribosomal protein L33 [Erysipelotrichaceae bacterium]